MRRYSIPTLAEFGGGDRRNAPVKSEYVPCHGMEQSIRVDLPPLGAVILKCVKKFPPRKQKKQVKK